MVVVREPVTAEVMSAKAATMADPSGVETATLKCWSRSEAAAAVHPATVTASTKMHAAAMAPAATKMHAASSVATSAEVTTTAATAATTTTTAMTVHLRGQAFRDLLGDT
jgi:hypothetical protein